MRLITFFLVLVRNIFVVILKIIFIIWPQLSQLIFLLEMNQLWEGRVWHLLLVVVTFLDSDEMNRRWSFYSIGSSYDTPPDISFSFSQVIMRNISPHGKISERSYSIRREIDYLIVDRMPSIVMHQHWHWNFPPFFLVVLLINIQDHGLTPDALSISAVNRHSFSQVITFDHTLSPPFLKFSHTSHIMNFFCLLWTSAHFIWDQAVQNRTDYWLASSNILATVGTVVWKKHALIYALIAECVSTSCLSRSHKHLKADGAGKLFSVQFAQGQWKVLIKIWSYLMDTWVLVSGLKLRGRFEFWLALLSSVTPLQSQLLFFLLVLQSQKSAADYGGDSLSDMLLKSSSVVVFPDMFAFVIVIGTFYLLAILAFTM